MEVSESGLIKPWYIFEKFLQSKIIRRLVNETKKVIATDLHVPLVLDQLKHSDLNFCQFR